jgi:putative FmdB family regulatory protein
MPIFDFECLSCGRSFDKLVRSSEAVSLVTCPECASENVKKKLSLFASRSGGSASTASAGASCSPGGL